MGHCEIADAIQRSYSPYLDIIPSNINLSGAEIELLDMEKREARLKDCLNLVADRYDFILIDSAGADTETGRELLLLADIVISPLQPTQAALDTIPLHYAILEEVILGNDRLDVFYLLNDCATHARDQEKIEASIEINSFLAEKSATLIPHFIYSRKLLKTSYSNGGTCFDSGKNKSKDEITKVIDMIFSE